MRLVATIMIVLTGATAFSQPRQITGRVVDEETQRGIAGATVTIHDNDRSTVTNQLGYFSLTVNPTDQGIIISSIGFRTSRIDAPQNNAFKAQVKRNYLKLIGLDLGTFPVEDLVPVESNGIKE